MAIKDAVFAVGEIQAIIQSGVPGAIKQTARGVATAANSLADNTITHGLTVDPAKTIVLLNTTVGQASGIAGGLIVPAVLIGVTSADFSCSGAGVIIPSGTVYSAKISWQLIEFF